MIYYVSLPVSDLERAGKFYDAFLEDFDAKRFVARDNFIAWGEEMSDTLMAVYKRKNETAKDADGVVVAFACDTEELVDRLFKRGLELGATEAIAIEKSQRGSYSGCLYDLDGHMIRLYCMSV